MSRLLAAVIVRVAVRKGLCSLVFTMNFTHRSHSKFRWPRRALALASAVLCWLNAAAQTVPAERPVAETGGADNNSVDEIVVTGVAANGGIKRQDAGFSVTTASQEQIRDLNPSNAADLLKLVPGVWPETSGGDTGANIDIAGFPSGGDAPFVTYELNGSPIYPGGSLSFMDNSSLFRLDETIERAEIVQGGPSVVTSAGQVGATANFILKEGTERPTGDIGVTVGSEGLYRLDSFIGGPIATGWYASFGGFYRYSDGIRKTQYPADNGGQVTATLSHRTENSSLMLYARELNDNNLFVTDIPLSVTGVGSSTRVSAFPGFNPGTGTFAGSGLRYISVQESPSGAPVAADLADGRGSTLHTIGSQWNWAPNSKVSISDKIMYSTGEVTCYCLFNNSAPQTLGSFVSEEIASTNANPNITGPYGAASTGSAVLSTSGAKINPNAYVASLGFWIIQKEVHSVTDEIRVSIQPTSHNNFTLGAYFAEYSAADHWWTGNNELVTVAPNAQLINLQLNNGVNVTNASGLLSGSSYSLQQNWKGRNAAIFASDLWQRGPWSLDGGYRVETQRDNGLIENMSSMALDADPRNLYNKSVAVPNGTFIRDVSCDTSAPFVPCTRYRHTFGAGTAGANLELTDWSSAFVRYSRGVHFPSFDYLRGGAPQPVRLTNYELGYHAQSATLAGSAVIFHRTFTGVAFQQFIDLPPNAPAGTLPYINGSYGIKSYGTELQARWQIAPQWILSLIGDKIHAVYTNYDNGSGDDYNGKVLDRQPSLQIRVTPEYRQPMGWGVLRVFATYSYAGLNYSDPANLQVLPAFYTLDGGVVANVGDHFEFRVQGSNLTNQLGLTEGNARTLPGSSGISTNFEMARPIFGREVRLQARYIF